VQQIHAIAMEQNQLLHLLLILFPNQRHHLMYLSHYCHSTANTKGLKHRINVFHDLNRTFLARTPMP
jgi:hypothetical protein